MNLDFKVEKQHIATVVIPQYIRKVVLAKSRAKKYYKKGEKLPVKYQQGLKKGTHEWYKHTNGILYLLDSETDERIVKNSRSAGTERKMVINGQVLHQLTLLKPHRSKIMQAIKEQMIPEVEKLDTILYYPIRIECEMFSTYEDWEYLKKDGKPQDINWDVDNHIIFHMKAFPDVLCGCPYIDTKEVDGEEVKFINYKSKRIIPDDHRKYITQPPVPLFTPIEDYSKRKLVFKIYHDVREEIRNSRFYN